MTARALALLALLLAVAASATPYMDGNTPDRAHKGIVMDSLAVPNGRSRGVYLIDIQAGQVRSNMDSTLNLWFNGGAAPRFRRIQSIKIWSAEGTDATVEVFDITVYREAGTTQNKGVTIQPFQYIEIPLEADSIRITSRTSPTLELSLAYW